MPSPCLANVPRRVKTDWTEASAGVIPDSVYQGKPLVHYNEVDISTSLRLNIWSYKCWPVIIGRFVVQNGELEATVRVGD